MQNAFLKAGCQACDGMDVYSLANQRHLKYPDLSTSENERLHLQCGLHMAILPSYPYKS